MKSQKVNAFCKSNWRVRLGCFFYYYYAHMYLFFSVIANGQCWEVEEIYKKLNNEVFVDVN